VVSRIRGWLTSHSVPIAAFAVSRIWLEVVVAAGLAAWPTGGAIPAQPAPLSAAPSQAWSRWDGEWYLSIAREGYTDLPRNQYGQRDTAFFPLYPMAIHVVASIVSDDILAARLLSLSAFLAALVLLYDLVLLHHSAEIANRSVVLLAFFPFSFFFSAYYSEALFLLLVVAAFLFGEKRRWAMASMAAALAAATRVTGILVILGLGVLYWEQRRLKAEAVRSDAAWLLLSLVGPLAFSGFLYARFGDPLLFVSSQYVTGWGSSSGFALALESIRALVTSDTASAAYYPAINVLHLVAWLASAFIALVAWKRLPFPYRAWMVVAVAAALPLWRSSGRYAVVIFPLFVGLALMLTDRRIYRLILVAFVFALGALATLFTHNYWTG